MQPPTSTVHLMYCRARRPCTKPVSGTRMEAFQAGKDHRDQTGHPCQVVAVTFEPLEQILPAFATEYLPPMEDLDGILLTADRADALVQDEVTTRLESVRGNVLHHLSPPIGWLRLDAAEGRSPKPEEVPVIIDRLLLGIDALNAGLGERT